VLSQNLSFFVLENQLRADHFCFDFSLPRPTICEFSLFQFQLRLLVFGFLKLSVFLRVRILQLILKVFDLKLSTDSFVSEFHVLLFELSLRLSLWFFCLISFNFHICNFRPVLLSLQCFLANILYYIISHRSELFLVLIRIWIFFFDGQFLRLFSYRSRCCCTSHVWGSVNRRKNNKCKQSNQSR